MKLINYSAVTIMVISTLWPRVEAKEIKRQTVGDYLKEYIRSGKTLPVEKARNVRCFYGMTQFTHANFQYQLFPDLGFYRIRPSTMHGNALTNIWLVIHEEIPNIDREAQHLPEGLTTHLLLVGSGLLKTDFVTIGGPLTAVEIHGFKTCKPPHPLWDGPGGEGLLLISDGDKIDQYMVRYGQSWKSVMDIDRGSQ